MLQDFNLLIFETQPENINGQKRKHNIKNSEIRRYHSVLNSVEPNKFQTIFLPFILIETN